MLYLYGCSLYTAYVYVIYYIWYMMIYVYVCIYIYIHKHLINFCKTMNQSNHVKSCQIYISESYRIAFWPVSIDFSGLWGGACHMASWGEADLIAGDGVLLTGHTMTAMTAIHLVIFRHPAECNAECSWSCSIATQCNSWPQLAEERFPLCPHCIRLFCPCSWGPNRCCEVKPEESSVR